jgi:hypothetical protein
VKFVLEVDISEMTGEGEAVKELGRILRYWAGGLKSVEDLKPGAGMAIYDSEYRDVGRWEIVES